MPYTLGTIEASEALIKDLYINLRKKVNAWSEITKQTSQARGLYRPTPHKRCDGLPRRQVGCAGV